MFDLKKAQKMMEERNIDGLIISSPENFYYVSGYAGMYFIGKTGMATAIIPKDEDPAIVIMDWEVEEAQRQTWIKDIRVFETWIYVEKEGKLSRGSKPEQFDPVQVIYETLIDKGINKGVLGVELASLPHMYFERLKNVVREANFVDADDLLLEMRSIKSREELNIIKEAVRITERGISSALELAEEGVEEKDIANEFRKVAVTSNCWGFAHIVVAGGAYSALPHFPIMSASTYKLRKGDFLRFDVGINFRGYLTDMARTYVIGPPSEKQKKLYNAILKAQRNMVESIKPGVKISDLFKIGMKTMRQSGFVNYVRGHLGHSISLGPFAEEPPFIKEAENRELVAGMLFCVEVPYYIQGLGGINIEDMVAVTEDGHEELTTLSRELIQL